MLESGSVRVSLRLYGFKVAFYDQTTQTTHSEHSQPISLYASRVPRLLASSVVAKEAGVDGTMSLSPTC